jgi:hypothetical protein
LLLIPIFLRSYVIFRFFISLSRYYDHRSDRITKLFGGEIGRLFTFKCMMTESPYKIIFYVTLATTCILSYMLRIFEYAPTVIDEAGTVEFRSTNFFYMSNCLWYIYITFLTVGYGDLFPLTNPGRVLGIVSAAFGTLIMSVLIIVIQDRFKLKPVESNVFVLLILDCDICR